MASITAEEAGRRICWAAPREQLGRYKSVRHSSPLLEKLGCRYGEKGVDCDENGGTSIPGVCVAAAASASALLRPFEPARRLEQAQWPRVPLDEATKPAR